MMTIHKLSVGDGYTYLTRHVAGGDVDRQRGQDAADYYTAEGNPPGKWAGTGITALALAPGDEVTEDQMRALFGLGLHPDADRIVAAYQAAHIKAGMTSEQLDTVNDQARKTAALGRAFPVYQALKPYEERVAKRLAVIAEEMQRPATDIEIAKVRREESVRQRAGVAGYDVVFAPVKSAALLWALDDRGEVQAAVRAAHEEAKASALQMLEQHAAYTRAGKGGVAQIETKGLVAVAFDHYDSRSGDPNLHTHVVLANKIQGTDGKWRSLDATTLYQMTVAASEHYNTAFETALTSRLNVRFSARPGTVAAKEPVREIDGVPAEWISLFSQRRTQLEARYDELLRDYRRAHGRDPSRATAHKLARQANLDTREGKKPPRSLAAMRADWREKISETYGDQALTALADITTAAAPKAAAGWTAERIDELAAIVAGRVAQSRATWTRWNLQAEAERLLREQYAEQLGSLAAQKAAVEAITDGAVSPRHSILVEAPRMLDEPQQLRRSDGASVFTRHGAARYTSQIILDAEQRLMQAALTPAVTGIPAAQVSASLAKFDAKHRHPLDAGQRELVAAFAMADTRIAVGIGAAGTGKTTAMTALRQVIEASGRRLIPLATSAAAAAVLGADIGAQAENLHKFLWEHTEGNGTHATQLHHGEPVPQHKQFFRIRPGDVILVDEAGMAGTLRLDHLLTIAERHGASVRLLGDYRQLGAVESGGALRLIVHEAGATELDTLHRFSNPAEADATRALRGGTTAALDFYQLHGRITGGSRQAMTDAVYDAWRTDMIAGKLSLMIAATNRDIGGLSARARAERVTAGQVETAGVTLADHNLAGRGDWIVTRHNQRRLATNRGRDWVKNGDAWTVERRYADGRLKVRHQEHGGRVTLPADYVATHVQLHYATTTHRAQGSTVDTAHLLVDDQLTRENLYVALTRGRHANHAYVATHELLPLDEDQRMDRPKHDPDARAAREVLEQILAREGVALSATETIRQSQEQAASLATLVPEYLYALERATTAGYQQLINRIFTPDLAHLLTADPAFSAIVRALHRGETAGWQPEQLLATAARRGPLAHGDSAAELLAWRIKDAIKEHRVPAHLVQPTAEDAARYAALVSTAIGMPQVLLNPQRALETPAAMSIDPALQQARATDHYQSIIVGVLGSHLAIKAAAEATWPALTAAVRRAEHAGHNPTETLKRAIAQRELDTADSISETLAWRIGRYLERHPATPTNDRAGLWTQLAWTLKAAEQQNVDLDTLFSRIEGTLSSDELLQYLHATIRPNPANTEATAPSAPWLPHPNTATDPDYTAHLAAASAQIAARIQQLGDDAARNRPAWTTVFGTQPDEPTAAANWLAHLSIAAAFRDQHQVTDDTAEQPLGPFVAPGRAGHASLNQAADSVVAGHYLARQEDRRAVDPVEAILASDIFSALSVEQQDRILARLASQGAQSPELTNLFAPGLAAQAEQLVAALREEGYLAAARRSGAGGHLRPSSQEAEILAAHVLAKDGYPLRPRV